MKPSREPPRVLMFDVSCRGCLQRIVSRQDLAIEVLSDEGFHRGWAHEECADDLPVGMMSEPEGRIAR